MRVAREVDHVNDFFGQEMNRTTFNLARMNMIMHGVHYRNFDIKQEDTLTQPQHLELKFEAVVANPPFSAKWSANKMFETDDRFSQYGKLAPASKADFAFVQHMLYQLDDSGTMAVVLPHGVLFRGAAEGDSPLPDRRTQLAGCRYRSAGQYFYGTGIPTCILVFKKCRQQPDDVLFIDASAHFAKAKNQNNLRPSDIDKIVNTYRQRTVEDKYSYRASLDEIKDNDYNLNIPRYVDTFEEEEPVDLDRVVSELKELEAGMTEIDQTIRNFCDELGIEAPV